MNVTHRDTRTGLRRVATGLITLTLAAGCTQLRGCFPDVRRSDAGNESFVRQAVPVLYGRKVRGYAEVKLLTDIIKLKPQEGDGRYLLLQALMAQPEFVDHWAEVLVDVLRVPREGFKSQDVAYATALRAGPDSNAIAAWVLAQPPGAPEAGGPFNMSDLLRSALTLDNLYPVYRAHLFALESRPMFFENSTDLPTRADLGATFGEVFLNRQLGCLGCHNSETSLSGAPSGWNRTFPVSGNFERAIYGSPIGEAPDEAFAFFRSDVLSGGTGSIAPWGLNGITLTPSVPVDPLGKTAHFANVTSQQATVFTLSSVLDTGYSRLDAHNLKRTLPPMLQQQCDFCAQNCSGATPSIPDIAKNAPNGPAVRTLLVNNCFSCHGGGADSLFIYNDDHWADDLIGQSAAGRPMEQRVLPGNASQSYLVKKLEGTPGIAGGPMPAGAAPLAAADIALVRQWIDGMPALTSCGTCPTLDCTQEPRYVEPEDAATYLVAANLVNRVWAHVLGAPLTIANYFPRNPDQRDILWNLTDYWFIPWNWSPRMLLSRILLSELFNRKAPFVGDGTTAYELPPVFDPWIVADPRVPPVSDPGYDPNAHPQDHFDTMGDSVHRYPARSLFDAVHSALGWPAAPRFPQPTGYPDRALVRAIGQYLSDDSAGFQGIDFQGLLHWESVHGACANPTAGDDWVDRLMAAIAAFPSNDPGGALSVRDVVVVLRDWLLADGHIGKAAPVGLTGTEEQALQTHFGVTSLDDPASQVTDLEPKLRDLCGVLLESAQFMLAGIAPTDLGPKPRLRVCNGAPCTYKEMCEALAPAVAKAFNVKTLLVRCGDDSVETEDIRDIKIDEALLDLCPLGPCRPIPNMVDKGCPANPGLCPTTPPQCDPRCARIDCCGGPRPAPAAIDPSRALLLAWAEGGQVRAAEGVRVLTARTREFADLQPGRPLAAGDLLVVPPGARLTIQTEAGKLEATGRRKDDQAPATRFLMVTGPSVLARKDLAPPPVPADRLLRMSRARWSHGEAGPTYDPQERAGRPVPEREVNLPMLIRRGLWPVARAGAAAANPSAEP